MAEITIINGDQENEPKNFSKGYLTFPFEGEQFKEFIVGLLGKPQTITKRILGTFEIHLKDLQSFHDLVTQRVIQQNNGRLIQFTSKNFYTDRSSVQLGSYDELVSYNEVKPIISEAVQLSWDFLIQFNNKTQPEKQSIELFIIAGNNLMFDDDEIMPFFLRSRGEFRINIQHTARTWGSDIENMLSHQIESHLIKPNKTRKLVRKYSASMSIGFGVLFFLSTIVGSFIVSQNFITQELRKVKLFTGIKTHTVNQQIDFLTSYIASGVSTQHYFKVSIFLLISLILSIAFGVFIETSASKNTEPSFLILTRKAKEYRDETKTKLRHDWKVFIASVLLTIITGIISNFIFNFLVNINL